MLEDEIYVKLITDSNATIQNKYSGIEDKTLKWKLIKMEIREITIPFSNNKAKQFKIDYKCLTGSFLTVLIIIIYYINTNKIPGELSREKLISSHEKITRYNTLGKILDWSTM